MDDAFWKKLDLTTRDLNPVPWETHIAPLFGEGGRRPSCLHAPVYVCSYRLWAFQGRDELFTLFHPRPYVPAGRERLT